MTMAASLGSTMENLHGVLEGRNERGIPSVKFIEDVDEFLQAEGKETKEVIEAFQEVYEELKRIDARLGKLVEQVQDAVPELESNLKVLAHAKKAKEQGKESMKTTFPLNSGLFTCADVDLSQGVVTMWLGAQTAAELTYDEATELLENNLKQKQKLLETTKEDLKFVKVQMTVAEVSIARVYNNDVKKRRMQRKAE